VNNGNRHHHGNGRAAIDSLPPHSSEAEAAVLGCCLLEPNCVRQVTERFATGDPFYEQRHAIIFRSMSDLFSRGVAVDLVTLMQDLRDKRRLDEIGGVVYLGELPNTTPSAANLDHYLDILREKFLARLAIRQHMEIAQQVQSLGGITEPVMAKAKRLQEEFDKETQRGALTPAYLKRALDFDEGFFGQFFGGKSEEPGLELPIDFKFKIRPQETTLVTGDDGSGKSTLLSYFALHLAQQDLKTLVASFEMPPQVTLWILAAQLLGAKHLPDSSTGHEQATRALAWLNARFYFYNFLGIGDWREVLDTFRYAATNLGVRLFILDSVMRIGIPDDDYAIQGFASAAFAQFCMDHEAHLFLVIHENKGKGDGKSRIRGSKLWSANVHNILRVERNDKKGQQIDDLAYDLQLAKKEEDEVEVRRIEQKLAEWRIKWDTHLVLQKQRYPGTQQNASKFFHFDPATFQFREHYGDVAVRWLDRWKQAKEP
jgi:energy-coupling factor transporter ATP-binding protein EcfA2